MNVQGRDIKDNVEGFVRGRPPKVPAEPQGLRLDCLEFPPKRSRSSFCAPDKVAKEKSWPYYTEVGPSREVWRGSPELPNRAFEAHDRRPGLFCFPLDVFPEVQLGVEDNPEVSGFLLPFKFHASNSDLRGRLDVPRARETHRYRFGRAQFKASLFHPFFNAVDGPLGAEEDRDRVRALHHGVDQGVLVDQGPVDVPVLPVMRDSVEAVSGTIAIRYYFPICFDVPVWVCDFVLVELGEEV